MWNESSILIVTKVVKLKNLAISDFYKRLKAPLANIQWSWGAQAEDGTVILRGWLHEVRKIDGKYQYLVLDDSWNDTSPLGYAERIKHLKLIEEGAKIRIVSMIVKDATQQIPHIKQYKSDALMIGTKIIRDGTLTYVEVDGIEKLTNGYRQG